MRSPFRADQVGSLLRPERLKRSREQYLGPQTPTSALGPHASAELRAVEDECIRDVVALQERLGLQAVTHGEFRPRRWWPDEILGGEGVAARPRRSAEPQWRVAAAP